MSNIIHTGRVVDSGGQPLVGANVLTVNEGQRRGVITGLNGEFTVDGQLHEVFQITFVGFEPKIFRLDRYMGKVTYLLKEDVFALDEFVGTNTKPFVPKPKTPSNNSLLQIFGGAAQTLFDNASVFQPFSPRTAQPKVLTTTNGIVYGQPMPITTTGSQGRVARPKITEWLNDNPLAAGGFLLGVIALGAFALKEE